MLLEAAAILVSNTSGPTRGRPCSDTTAANEKSRSAPHIRKIRDRGRNARTLFGV
jgi:hypothetical protein